MIQLIRPAARGIAAAGLIGSALLAGPAWAASAQATSPVLLAQADTAAKTLAAHQAQLLLAAGNPETEAAPVWRKVG